ncbi:MAG: FAD/NAD(P)-binding oxidoreductase, partial [Desulfobacterales bacterium]
MNVNVVVIGGGPAGIITSLTAKSVYPEKSIYLIKDIGDGVIPCAIPYMVHTLKDPNQNAMGNTPLDEAGVDVIVGKVISFNPQAHSVTLSSGQVLYYERLVLATGTEPVLPPISGIEKEGVVTIRKSMSAMAELREKVHEAKSVVIVGGGFIGAEFADELSHGYRTVVHLIEIMPKILVTAFDDEFCDEVANVLGSKGILIHCGNRVLSIDGTSKVESVTLESGEKIPVDMVLVSIGAKPASELAQKAGLRIVEN